MIINKYTFKHITKEDEHSEKMFVDIQRIWELRGGNNDLASLLKEKAFHEKKYIVQTYLMFDGDNVCGITWFELTTNSYGNVSMHITDPIYAEPMVDFLLSKSLFDYRMIEIVNMDDSTIIRDKLYRKNLIANIRQRMSLWLSKDYYYQEEQHPFIFKQYEQQDMEWAAKLSLQSHQISKDYKMYDEMNSLERRIGLEQRVWDKWYGNIIHPASLVVFHNNQPVGYCLVIEVKCWGYEYVPWVFDICIDPAFHGQGIGKAMSYRYLNILTEMDYPIMGLAVTLSNTFAKALYEKCGFQMVDIFYEFTKRD